MQKFHYFPCPWKMVIFLSPDHGNMLYDQSYTCTIKTEQLQLNLPKWSPLVHDNTFLSQTEPHIWDLWYIM